STASAAYWLNERFNVALIKLKNLLKKTESAGPLLLAVSALNPSLTLWDDIGNLILQTGVTSGDTYPITLQNKSIGRLQSSDPSASIVALFLTALAAKEAENVTLLDNTLDLYRELNLLYNLSEKLATALEPVPLASIVLHEASRL